MASPLQLFEILCLDDDSLHKFLPVLEKIKHFFVFKEDDEFAISALLKFNKEFSLGFMKNKESGATYFVVNDKPFCLGVGCELYRKELRKIAKFFQVDDSTKFINRVLLPWTCYYFQSIFEIDVSDLN